jgi:acetyl-CoA carboxylase biotin carboxyl carrier protein
MPSTHEIVSAMPGTFYRRSDPSADPYVSVGAIVGPDDIVGTVEVMKMFHELRAGVTGTLIEFVLDDGDIVTMGGVVARVEGPHG